MGRRRLLLPSLALLGVALAGSAHDAAALITRGALDIPLAEKVAVVGDRAYVVTQGLFPVLAARLVVVDVADPEAPRILGELDLGFPEAQDLAVAGGYAYVAAGFEGFYVFDVSDPSAPRQVAALEETPAGAVWVEGTRAYLAGAFAGGPRGQTIVTGLHVLDVTDPAAPVEIGDLPNAGGSDIAVSDGFAYVSQRFSLLLVDVRDPTLPVALEEIPTSGASIELAGGLAYVSGLGLQVLDLSDPAAPVEIGGFQPAPPFADWTACAVAGDLAYVVDDSGLRAIDVSDPTAPAPLGAVRVDATALAVAGGFAYTVGLNGLRVIDLARPEFPRQVGGLAGIPATDVEVGAGLAYVGLGDVFDPVPGGLAIVDVADPASPAVLGELPTPDTVYDVEVSGDRAYLAAGLGGLVVVDISDASGPRVLGQLASGGNAVKVKVAGGLAYVLEARSPTGPPPPAELRFVDVSDPTAPRSLGSVPPGGSFCPDPGLAVRAGLAYVTCSTFHVIDVSDPAAPVPLGAVTGRGEVALAGPLAFVAGGWFSVGFRVLDVSDPTSPQGVAVVPTLDGADLELRDGRAWLGGRSGMMLLDLSDPPAPRELGGFPFPSVLGVAGSGRLAYLAGRAGFGSVDLGPEYALPLGVGVDVRPGTIQPGSHGVIPVVVFGSEGFDVTAVDPATLAFGPAGAPLAHRNGPHFRDADRDGHTDLLAHFRSEESGIGLGDTQVCVSGELRDGTAFRGCAAIRTPPPGGRGRRNGHARGASLRSGKPTSPSAAGVRARGAALGTAGPTRVARPR